MSQPGHEQEREVALLRRHVAEKERAQAASDILCRSLAEETHQLRRTLAATAHMCQHLARSLDELQRAQGAAGERNPEVGPCACRPWGWGRGRGSVSERSAPPALRRLGAQSPLLFSGF